MAPEQTDERAKQVGPTVDVYGLGTILYQALIGRPPFLGGSALETIRLVNSTEVVPPRQSRPEVPKDLETICLKCLQKEPTKRYGSALALADDLLRFLHDRPITARPVGPVGRPWRWGRRNPREILHKLTATASNWESRIQYAERSNEIFTALLREDPQAHEHASWISCIGLNFHNIGHEYFEESRSATGQRKSDLMRKAGQAFSDGLRFCARQVEPKDLLDQVLHPRALNERYLCRTRLQQASLLQDLHQRTETFDEAIVWGKKAITDFEALSGQDPSNFQRSHLLHDAQRELGIALFTRESSSAISLLPIRHAGRLRQRPCSLYASEAGSGSCVFQPSSAPRTGWIAVARSNGGQEGRNPAR
jgi:hypothetical protein